jgi:hypothetical protein
VEQSDERLQRVRPAAAEREARSSARRPAAISLLSQRDLS